MRMGEEVGLGKEAESEESEEEDISAREQPQIQPGTIEGL